MKVKIENYVFNKTAKTVTFTDFVGFDLSNLLLITNVTRNVIIYNFADFLKGGSIVGNVLTLWFDTSLQDDSDSLQILAFTNVVSENAPTGYSEISVASHSHVCSHNSSSAPLDIDGVFDGDWQDSLDYSEIIVSVGTDKASAENGLQVLWSADGISPDGYDIYTIAAGVDKTFSFPCQRRYVKVVYINGSIAQTVFKLSTLFKRFASKGSSHKLASDLDSQDDAIVVKAMLTGFVEATKEINNVSLTNKKNLKVALSEYQGDAFGRLRVSEPFTIFDNSLTTPEADSLIWSQKTNGIGSSTYDRMSSKVTLSATGVGAYIVRQTKQRFKYQPGKSHLILITGLLHTEMGWRKRVGYLDYDNVDLPVITNVPQNGIFFQNLEGILSWHIVNNGVITESVLQADWNVDKCDGLGVGGFLLDIASTNIFFIDLEWLGVGAVRVGFVNGSGEIVVCHQFQHASKGFTDVYMRTANLAIGYELTSISAAGTGTLKQICCSVISEGGFNPQGLFQSVYNTVAQSITNLSPELLIGVRLKPEFFEYSVIFDAISLVTSTTGTTRWTLVINPTYVGTPIWVDEPNSVVQKCIGPNIVASSLGVILASGVYGSSTSAASQTVSNSLKIGKSLTDVLDEFWLIVTPLSGQTESYFATLNFRELI